MLMNSSSIPLHDLACLNESQKKYLHSGGLKCIADLVLCSPNELAKKLRKPLSEIQRVIELVFKESAASLEERDNSLSLGTQDVAFTTGDAVLDRCLGGGLRTSMIWEICGESASGKTQLALQLSLAAQLPLADRGASGSTCFLTTNSKLPTSRLIEIVDSHPDFSANNCSLDGIHTMAVATVEMLLHVLRSSLPTLIASVAADETKKPIRLVIIDSFSVLFTASDKTTSSTLADRSKSLTTISSILHTMAAQHNIAFVTINTVKDVFSIYVGGDAEANQHADIIYSRQSRWFNSDPLAPGGNQKEATLGLVWANQLNARVMLTRTNRRRALDEVRPAKRRRTENTFMSAAERHGSVDDTRIDNSTSVLLRRFAVLFSTVSEPRSVDFVITAAGLIGSEEERSNDGMAKSVFVDIKQVAEHSVPTRAQFPNVVPSSQLEEEELADDDLYWGTLNDFTNNELLSIDYDKLDEANVNEELRASQIELSEAG